MNGCRFSRGYATGVTLGPLARAPTLPTVLAFATDQALGYPHYRKHLPGLTGTAVLEQLRMAWTSARHTVIRGREEAIIWVVDHEAFFRVFAAERVWIVVKTCASYGNGTHCCDECGRAERPGKMTLRSVRPWTQARADGPVLYTDVAPQDLAEYLAGPPERWIGQRFRIASSSPFSQPWPRHEFHYGVPLMLDGRLTISRVVASKRQSELIDADEAGFARTHDVIFRSRLRTGALAAFFVPRR